jgi:hypothetical protein
MKQDSQINRAITRAKQIREQAQYDHGVLVQSETFMRHNELPTDQVHKAIEKAWELRAKAFEDLARLEEAAGIIAWQELMEAGQMAGRMSKR